MYPGLNVGTRTGGVLQSLFQSCVEHYRALDAGAELEGINHNALPFACSTTTLEKTFVIRLLYLVEIIGQLVADGEFVLFWATLGMPLDMKENRKIHRQNHGCT